MSERSRQTRRERRARRRLTRLVESAGAGGRLLWKFLCSGGLLASLAGIVVTVLAGRYALTVLFALLAGLLYGVLWWGERAS